MRYHYDVWAAPYENGDSVLDRILRKLAEAQREQDYRNARTTMIIVDSKSIQNADNAEEKGHDTKKTSGIKLCIGVDVLGLPHTLMVITANVTDRRGATDMIAHYCDVTGHLSWLQKVDGGYTLVKSSPMK